MKTIDRQLDWIVSYTILVRVNLKGRPSVFWRRIVSAAALLPLLVVVCGAQIGNYETSWVGNTFGGKPDMLHVQLNIDGLFVSSDGHCYTTSSWDEGGRTDSIYQNGGLTTPPDFCGDLNSDQVATDSSGNIYVSQNGSGPGYLPGGDIGNGAVLESYQPNGARNWISQGLEFVSLADVDPGSETDVYDLGHHFTMNYANTVAGTEWSYRSCTYNQFKYPNDPRYRHDLTVVNSVYARRIQGKLFLFMSNQAGAFFMIYRFNPATDGDIAIPCGGFSYGAFQNKYTDLANSPTNGEWIWYDANANGNPEPNEFTQPANAQHIDNQWWWTDSNGDVWESRGEGPAIGHYVCQGLDTNGIPKYDWNHFTALAAPSGFTDVAKILYFPANDTMYLMGNSLSQLACYTNWSAGNRTATWSVAIPNSGPSTVSPEGMAGAGGYVFINYYVPHQILVYNATNGVFAGSLIPGPEVGGQGAVGNVDQPMCINAYQRTNGEYLIFGEEDYQTKVLMYRWNPSVVVSSGTNFIEGANVTSPTTMAVGFSPYAIDSASVVPSNFTIKNAQGVGLNVTGATLDDSCHQYVVLNISPSTPFSLTNGAKYVVSVNGITSSNGSLTIAPNSRATNTLGGAVLLRYFNVNNTSGTIADLLTEPNFVDNTPAQTYLEQAIEQTDGNGPFGEQWLGYFQPPATGDYTFHINSDGQSELFLSLDSTVTNEQMLCAQYGAGPSRAWINGDYSCCNDNPAAKASAPTYLVAGNKYFLQALYEGPGNQDKNCSVTWAYTSGGVSYSVTNYNTPRSVGLVPWALTNGQVWVTPAATNPAAGTPFELTGQSLVAPTGPNSYRWYLNGALILNATGENYIVTSAERNHTGNYQLVLTTKNPSLSFTSAPVMVAVNLPQATMTYTCTQTNSAAALVLGWGVAGVLQQTPSLSPAGWVAVPGAPSGTNGGTYNIPLANTQPAMYYRLKQWP